MFERRLFLSTASPCSSAAISSEGIMFIRTDGNPLWGRGWWWVGDSLHCEEEKDNEYDKNVVGLVYDSFHLNEVVGQFPLYWGKLVNKFLNHHTGVVVTCKRVNRGIGLGQEIPVDYFFHGDNQVIECFEKSANVTVEKCIK